jgi:hypothetical protein
MVACTVGRKDAAMSVSTEKLTVEQILKAIDQLSGEDRACLDHELEEREWQKLYQDPAFIAMMKERVAEAEKARQEGKLKTLEELRVELEAEGRG